MDRPLPPLLAPPATLDDVDVFTLWLPVIHSRQYRRVMWARHSRKVHLSPLVIRGAATTPAILSYHIVRLRMSGHEQELSFLFRDTDEYLIAFRNGQGIWFQFLDHAVPAYFNPRRLPLKGHHESIPNTPCQNTTVGLFTFLDIYNGLINFNERKYGGLERRMLHASVLIFSEASRYRSVRRLVSFNIDKGINTVLTKRMWDRIFHWKCLSKYGLGCWQKLQDGQDELPVNETVEGLGVTCFRDAVGAPRGDIILLRFDAAYFPDQP